jgi:hypothetical protein
VANLNPEVITDHPSVDISTLDAPEGGFFVLANRSAQIVQVMVSSTLPVKKLARITTDGSQPLRRDGPGWRLSLKPHEGAVLQWLP